MNMFQQAGAKTVKEYLDMLPAERHKPIDFMHAFIQKVAPTLSPHFAHNMLGYGSFPYKNYKKEIIDWPTVALASQKNYMSLYVCAVQNGEYLAEKYKNDLGKVSVGKSCIRFKKVEDINLEVLSTIIQLAAKKPGLKGVGASAKK